MQSGFPALHPAARQYGRGGDVSLTTSCAHVSCTLHMLPRLILFLCLYGILGSGRGNSSPGQRKECSIQFPLEERGLVLLLEESMTSGLIINLGLDRPLGKHFLSCGTKCSSETVLQGCSALILSQWRRHFNQFLHVCTFYN